MWLAAGTRAAILMTMFLARLAPGVDDHPAVLFGVATVSAFASAGTVRWPLAPVCRGPLRVVSAPSRGFAVAAVVTWLRAAHQPDPARPEVGIRAGCQRVLYDDGGHERDVDCDDLACLCPAPVRNPARRRQIVRV